MSCLDVYRQSVRTGPKSLFCPAVIQPCPILSAACRLPCLKVQASWRKARCHMYSLCKLRLQVCTHVSQNRDSEQAPYLEERRLQLVCNRTESSFKVSRELLLPWTPRAATCDHETRRPPQVVTYNSGLVKASKERKPIPK